MNRYIRIGDLTVSDMAFIDKNLKKKWDKRKQFITRVDIHLNPRTKNLQSLQTSKMCSIFRGGVTELFQLVGVKWRT